MEYTVECTFCHEQPNLQKDFILIKVTSGAVDGDDGLTFIACHPCAKRLKWQWENLSSEKKALESLEGEG